MSEYIHERHNVTILMYYLVFPAKYRTVIFGSKVDEVLKGICLEVEKLLSQQYSSARLKGLALTLLIQ
tara:strand:- start:4644 stop:4847 length:204 start_codon:yes stop_codon:yes gene_type:complete